MKAKVKLTGEIIEVERITSCLYGRTDGATLLYPKDALDLNPDPTASRATIGGWIVRDKQNTTSILAHRGSKLYLCQKKPKRIDSMGIWDKDSDYYRIPDDLFPNVAFDSDPLEVEITIKPKKR